MPEVLAVVREQVGQGQVVGHRSRLWPTAANGRGHGPGASGDGGDRVSRPRRCAAIGGEGPRAVRVRSGAGLSIRPRAVRRTAVFSTRTAVREPEGERHGSVRRPDLRRRERLGQHRPKMWDQVMKAHDRFAEQVAELGGDDRSAATRCSPPPTATSIRGDVVTDGPFVETKEALGGFYLIEARDLDHAIEIAKLCPAPAVASRSGPCWTRRPGRSGAGRAGRRRSVRPSPTRTVASGPACSPRRCASPRDLDLAEECAQDAYVAGAGRPGRATACRATRARG